MAQCRGVTKSGQPCRNEALPGTDFCRYHGPKGAEAIPEEVPVLVVHGPRMVKIKYVGQGTYQTAYYTFTTDDRVQEVPERLAEFLLDTEPERFILADRED